MKFQYKKVSQNAVRPIVDVGLSYNRGAKQNIYALIDSGADYCLFGKQIGELLGIQVRKGKYMPMTGISGKKQHGYLHKITVTIGGWDIEINAVFLSDDDLPMSLLGQVGFFEKTKISFDYEKGEIEVKIK